jgi:uncharacterized caspase-like protein
MLDARVSMTDIAALNAVKTLFLKSCRAVAVAGCVILILGASPARAEKRVALVVGVSKYLNVPALGSAVNDAAAMSEAFKKSGFDSVDLKQNPGVLELRRILREFSEKANGADVAVVYYAGYGVDVDGINYLIPADAKLQSASDILDEAVDLDRVLQQIGSAKQLRLVILEAAHDNPFVKTMKRDGRIRVGNGLARIESATPGTLVALAAKAGTIVSQDNGERSRYTAALIQYLLSPDRDLVVVFRLARDDVLKQSNNRQEPFVYGALGRETVSLSPKASGSPAGPAIIQAEPPMVASQPPPPPAKPVTALVTSKPAVETLGPAISSNYASLPEFGRRVALVIGNSAYKDAPVLPNPTRDAAAIANELQRLGFQAVSLETNLGREKMIDALRSFARQAQTADWALVYFAGHGMEVGGVNYLLPVDAAIESDLDMPFAAVPLDQVLNATDRARKLRLVILDACRNNPYANRMTRTADVSSRSVVSRGFSRVEPNAGTLVVYAAKDGQTASDGEGANSPFTVALLKNLERPGIELRRMFDNVRDDVQEFTRQRQLPYTYGSITGKEDFYFAR